MGVPFYVMCRFSLVAFNNFSLSLIFVNLITVCLGMFLLGFILPGTLCSFWTWVAISFPMLGKFSTIVSSNIFSDPFSLSSPSGTPIMRMLVHLMLSQSSLRLSSFFFSSRRRHTRSLCDWSSDVCSSDLFPDHTVYHLLGFSCMFST